MKKKKFKFDKKAVKKLVEKIKKGNYLEIAPPTYLNLKPKKTTSNIKRVEIILDGTKESLKEMVGKVEALNKLGLEVFIERGVEFKIIAERK